MAPQSRSALAEPEHAALLSISPKQRDHWSRLPAEIQMQILKLAIYDLDQEICGSKEERGFMGQMPQDHNARPPFQFAPVFVNRSAIALMLPYIRDVLLPQAQWRQQYQNGITKKLDRRVEEYNRRGWVMQFAHHSQQQRAAMVFMAYVESVVILMGSLTGATADHMCDFCDQSDDLVAHIVEANEALILCSCLDNAPMAGSQEHPVPHYPFESHRRKIQMLVAKVEMDESSSDYGSEESSDESLDESSYDSARARSMRTCWQLEDFTS